MPINEPDQDRSLVMQEESPLEPEESKNPEIQEIEEISPSN